MLNVSISALINALFSIVEAISDLLPEERSEARQFVPEVLESIEKLQSVLKK